MSQESYLDRLSARLDAGWAYLETHPADFEADRHWRRLHEEYWKAWNMDAQLSRMSVLQARFEVRWRETDRTKFDIAAVYISKHPDLELLGQIWVSGEGVLIVLGPDDNQIILEAVQPNLAALTPIDVVRIP